MPREKSPSVLDKDFHLTRGPPRFVRRQHQGNETEEQLHYQVPPSPPTPPQPVYTVPSSDDEEDDVKFIGKTEEDCEGPSSLSSQQAIKNNSSTDCDTKTDIAAISSLSGTGSRISQEDNRKARGDNDEVIVIDDEDDQWGNEETEIVTGVFATTEEEECHRDSLANISSSDGDHGHGRTEIGTTNSYTISYSRRTVAREYQGECGEDEVILVEGNDDDDLGSVAEFDYATRDLTADKTTGGTPAKSFGGSVPTSFLGLTQQVPVAAEVLRGRVPASYQVGESETGDKTDKNGCEVSEVISAPVDPGDNSKDSRGSSRSRRRDGSHERRSSSKSQQKTRKSSRSRSRSPHRRRESRSRTPKRDRKSRSCSPQRRSVTPTRKRRSRTPDRQQRSRKRSHKSNKKRDHGRDGHRRRRRHRSRSSSRRKHHRDEARGRRSRSAESDRDRKQKRGDSDRHRSEKKTETRSHRHPHDGHREKSSPNPEPEKPQSPAKETPPLITKTPTLKLSENEILRLIKTCREPGCDNKKFQTRKKATTHLKEVHDRQLCFVCFHSFSTKGVEHTNHFIQAHAEGEEETAMCPVESCSKKIGVNGMYVHLSAVHLVPREKMEERRRRGRRGGD